MTFFNQRSEVAPEVIDTSDLDPLGLAFLESLADVMPVAFGGAVGLREVALPNFGVGVDLDFTREDKSARLNYLAEIGWYADNSGYNYDNHLVDAAVDLQFVSGLMVFVGNVFRVTNDRLTYEFIPLIERRQNSSDVKVGYEFTDRLSVQAAYDHARRRGLRFEAITHEKRRSGLFA